MLLSAKTVKSKKLPYKKFWVKDRFVLIQEIPQLLGAAGVAQLAQGLGLDLADTLTGDVELLADLLQGAGAAVHDAEAQLQHLLQLLAQQGEAGGLGGL